MDLKRSIVLAVRLSAVYLQMDHELHTLRSLMKRVIPLLLGRDGIKSWLQNSETSPRRKREFVVGSIHAGSLNSD